MNTERLQTLLETLWEAGPAWVMLRIEWASRHNDYVAFGSERLNSSGNLEVFTAPSAETPWVVFWSGPRKLDRGWAYGETPEKALTAAEKLVGEQVRSRMDKLGQAYGADR